MPSTRTVLPKALLRAPLVLGMLAPLDAAAQQAADVGERPVPATEAVDPMSVPRPSLAVGWTDGPITLDGRLDEAAWGTGDVSAEPFWLAIPRQGVRQDFVTEVRVLQDGAALYFGVELHDPGAAGIVTAGLEQDFETQDSDVFGIALDTYHDRSNGFVWAINPEGAVFDAQSFNDSREIERAWEGVVETGARRHEGGWTLEMRIPFTTLRYRPSAEPQTWGMNLFRRVKRRNEDAMWAALPRQFRPYKFSLAGTLTGVRVGEPGRNLGVKPYALASATGGGAVEGATTGDVGVDVKWGITPRLTLDATVNTDFSQVEVDQEQVNLTRFSLFFPEKRDFFLENDGTFAFQDVGIRNFRTGSGPRSFRLFHSRRIGLGADRRPVPILGGVRLTGRAGGFELGLLEMQTAPDGDIASENFAVARVRRDVGMGLSLGGMVVNRQMTGGVEPTSGGPGEGRPWNRAWGADLNWSPRREMVVSAYGARTDHGGGWDAGDVAPGGEGDRNTAMLQVAWRDPLWNTSLLVKHVGGGFDPGVGFVARRGVRRLFTTLGAHPQPGIRGIVEVNPYVDADWFTTLSGVMETREITPGLGITFADNGALTLEY
ncbi:MAG: carbohydrate binding family 9 domain-containing protein, partial [Gemmatimonadetes bacterium]|nr:carbohydrate binding family 9 domain-containing protein [Gemmatimonadota bacterium]